MKMIVILTGLLSASLLAVAQDPTGITSDQTNRVHQPAVFPDTSRPQQLNATNQTNRESSTNLPSSVTSSNNSSHITIIRGSDTSTGASGTSDSGRHLPPNGDGVQVMTNTTGTANDWRSGGSVPHVVPPRDPATNP